MSVSDGFTLLLFEDDDEVTMLWCWLLLALGVQPHNIVVNVADDRQDDSYSLEQPYAGRPVPSFASDNTKPQAPY